MRIESERMNSRLNAASIAVADEIIDNISQLRQQLPFVFHTVTIVAPTLERVNAIGSAMQIEITIESRMLYRGREYPDVFVDFFLPERDTDWKRQLRGKTRPFILVDAEIGHDFIQSEQAQAMSVGTLVSANRFGKVPNDLFLLVDVT